MILTVHFHVLFLIGLYDTVFDVDHDKERAEAQGLEPNGFSFDGVYVFSGLYLPGTMVGIGSTGCARQ